MFTSTATHHDEHQVGQLPQGAVLPKGLYEGGDVLLGIWAAHGQDGWLARVAQETSDLLQEREVEISQCDVPQGTQKLNLAQAAINQDGWPAGVAQHNQSAAVERQDVVGACMATASATLLHTIQKHVGSHIC